MNNLSIKIKQLVSNKNVVTALCFVLIGVVLILGYNSQIKKATTPIRVPYANVDISPQTVITEDMIGYMDLPSAGVNQELMYTDINEIKGKAVKLESKIPSGSFFYKNSICPVEELPTTALLDIEDGYTLINLPIDMQKSYFKTIVPGDYIDLYIRTIGVIDSKANDSKKKNDEIIVGKFISAIKILAVKDSSGENVFDGGENRVPAAILFAVPEKTALLIMKAQYFTELSQVKMIEFVAIPRGQSYNKNGEEVVKPEISSESLEKYIEEKTAEIDIKKATQN